MFTKKKLSVLIAALLLAGCANQQSPGSDEQPQDHQQQLIHSLDKLKQQRLADPQDLTLKSREQLESSQLVDLYLKQAERAVAQNNHQDAARLWRTALQYQPGNMRAQQGLRRINAWRSLDMMYQQASKLAANNPQAALEKIQKVLEEEPGWPQATALRDHLLRQLSSSTQPSQRMSAELQKPVSLNFRSHNLMEIFNTISKITGVNFIFDNDVSRNISTSIIANKTTAEDAINLLLISNQLRKKVLNGNTLLIYPASQNKEKIYRDIMVKTFFLGYAKAKDVNVALRNLMKIKDIHVDERTNSLTVRSPRESIEMIERLLMTLDRPEAEVTLEVEVLEINSNDATKLGIRYPGEIGIGFNGGADASSNIPLNAFGRDNMFINLGSSRGLKLDISKIRSHAKVLANPRIHVKNSKQALIEIGEKLPVLTNTTNDGVTNQKVEYQDVGLKLQVTPEISLDGEISMDVEFSLSSLGLAQESKDGLKYYSTNNRMAKTILSSLDGETQMLAGLISMNQKNDKSGIPGLSNLPLIGSLFSTSDKEKKRTEVVLLITPRIARSIDLPGSHINAIAVGTEDLPGDQDMRLRAAGRIQVGKEAAVAPPLAPPAHFPQQRGELPSPNPAHDNAARSAP
ncbi:bacterial type II and III secretion system family protein [Erwiniaceae bacterium BAC15a-03b]|uniref:Bacterial type II and III secretion system family protein n=1 Tax=Winslowiella arboricola TaxID=2978220 RepID=A0A9J6PNC7_9GAMM|nr:secretin N-terminal domain-containing protein [Winslowiella arboricola]MCU5772720.1 bacterial type II and III secretion system family protein [Winslowiella arboricola]MCU5778270.1 bacterial type II and III secretion system family protein [Winslowiella arboricola]